MNNKDQFVEFLKQSISEDTFVRLTLSKPVDGSSSFKKMIVNLAHIKGALQLSIVARHKTNDITKNYPLAEGIDLIEEKLVQTFLIGNLFTIEQDYILDTNKKGVAKLFKKKPSFNTLPAKTHDKQKKKFITQNNYLVELGVLDDKGRIKKDKGDKYKQINKFVEIFDSLVRKTPALKSRDLTVYDMGSGKGYLTFAVYDYLTNQLGVKAEVTGVEIRKDLVELCNHISKQVKFDQLQFSEGFIDSYELQKTDVLIALHACDTATDDAIYKGVQADADLIICAPCCHKQIRKQLQPVYPLSEITTHGILKERQAEMLTDTIRALILEAQGYKTKIFEFISLEHTGKNVMLVGQKHQEPIDRESILKRISDLKSSFGINYHYLEQLFAK